MSPVLYLASASPRRRELLAQLGVSFELVLPDIEECQQPGETAADYVQRLAYSKAQAGAVMAPLPLPVLGGDTIVVQNDEVLEKPRSEAHGKAMLRRLSGSTHRVMTAMALVTPTGCQGVLVTTEVTFRCLSEDDIARYWQSGEPADKAGGYGIQGLGGRFVSRINGSYSAVVGLPLVETEALLQRSGVVTA
ncbi:Maf family protein [Oceanimonas baumannii]|uniref:dTTP/UTP pyrophosphatase n=1 Tax=Oceanimonas baumannii TaxID=129578 RepID=A0A235CJ48_9GAMM|nr:nucleoside triphosphate pyrophosphatase [Oceanimonas baumannii]OYD24562.1 septum formation protein Maf [Oceanimonas baumannii]TDW59297.1 septum formation protein [Oceanimonas baumannii]